MQPTYFASFLLGNPGQEEPVRLRDILPLLENWIFSNPNRAVPKPAEFDALTDSTHTLSDDTLLQTRYLITDAAEYFALRYEHGDGSRRWRTDVVIDASSGIGREVRCSVGVNVGNQYGELAPLGDVASRPGIVPKLMETFGAYEAFPLRADALTVRLADVDVFAQLLQSKQRHLPIIMITPTNADGRLLVNAKRIANQLAGIAYVVIAESSYVTYAIKDIIGNDLNAYNGAVRLYWPGFSTSDSPYRHTLWLQPRIWDIDAQRNGFPQYLLRLLSRLSATRHVPGVVRWEDVQRKKLHLDARNAQGEGELRNLLELALEENEQYRLQVEQLRSESDLIGIELEIKNGELEIKQAEADQWRNAYVEAVKNNPPPEAEPEDGAITDVSEAIEKAFQLHADQIMRIGSSLRKEALLFEKPEMVFKALRWLATEYRDSRLGKASCPDLDHSCRTAVGMFYRSHQSMITMKTYKDDYKVVRDGKTEWLKEHIGVGTGTDPRSNLRIAFYFDVDDQKVVVGFIGQHQETSASN